METFKIVFLFVKYQEKICITSRDLFKTTSVITLVHFSVKDKANVYYRPQSYEPIRRTFKRYLDDSPENVF